MAGISKELDTLACALIGVAIDLLEAGAPVPVMLATDSEGDFATFEDDEPDGCYRAACAYIAGLKGACTRYALLYPGVVAEDETDPGSEALLVEFAERGMPNAWSGYLFYRSAQDGTIEVTDPLPAGEEELLFG